VSITEIIPISSPEQDIPPLAASAELPTLTSTPISQSPSPTTASGFTPRNSLKYIVGKSDCIILGNIIQLEVLVQIQII
jgi:hypothetical protein